MVDPSGRSFLPYMFCAGIRQYVLVARALSYNGRCLCTTLLTSAPYALLHIVGNIGGRFIDNSRRARDGSGVALYSSLEILSAVCFDLCSHTVTCVVPT